jgi:hypothetical protein
MPHQLKIKTEAGVTAVTDEELILDDGHDSRKIRYKFLKRPH